MGRQVRVQKSSYRTTAPCERRAQGRMERSLLSPQGKILPLWCSSAVKRGKVERRRWQQQQQQHCSRATERGASTSHALRQRSEPTWRHLLCYAVPHRGTLPRDRLACGETPRMANDFSQVTTTDRNYQKGLDPSRQPNSAEVR